MKAQFRLNASPVESHRKAPAGGELIRFLTCSTETSLEAVSGDGDGERESRNMSTRFSGSNLYF